MLSLLKKTIKLLLRSTLLVALVLGSIVGFEEVRELSIQYTASKAHPFKMKGRTVCSSSQIEFKGERFTLTNMHCCKALSPRTTNNAKKNIYSGADTTGKFAIIDETLQEVLKIDKKHDLCVLTPDLTKPAFRVAKTYKIGEPIHVIGHPRGMPQTIREGRIVSKEYDYMYWLSRDHKLPYLLVSNLGYGGNSGSPVVDRYGQLVGVIFMCWSSYHTEMGAVPLENVREFLERVVAE